MRNQMALKRSSFSEIVQIKCIMSILERSITGCMLNQVLTADKLFNPVSMLL